MSNRTIQSLHPSVDRAQWAARFRRLAPQLAEYPNLPAATTEVILDAFSAASGSGFPGELPDGGRWPALSLSDGYYRRDPATEFRGS